jgi:glycosyltransferase involved in cell wall biosynthesis
LLDDNFWELTPDFDIHLAPYFGHPAVRATLDRFMRGAAVVIVWSERLRDYISARFPGIAVEFVPSGVDLAQIRRLRPPGGRADDGVVRIGYPTSRRLGVASLLAEVVRAIVGKYPGRVQFEFVGWMPEALEDLPNVTLMPQIAEYDAYLAFVLSRQWDVGLAPLAGVHFESFKTDVKYREYAAFRVAGVYSRVSPYTETVQAGRTGVLVDNDPQEWIAALAALIESPRMREDIVAAAFADVSAHRDIEVTGRRFASLLPSPGDGRQAT